MKNSTTRTLTLGRLARAAGLARASLLHYESLGLLVPAARRASGYRLYSDAEIERLATIRRLREAGLSLTAIRDLLHTRARPDVAAELLEQRLLELAVEVERLRGQQQLLARLLAAPALRRRESRLDKAGWVDLLRRAGLSDADMRTWHVGFEADDPRGHAKFLRTLGLPASEIGRIRRWSKE
jgi:MerR family transcriptional regulator, thiopeptide resistance regulator